MKSSRSAKFRSRILAPAAVLAGVILCLPVLIMAGEVALLVQHTPQRGGTVKPGTGLMKFQEDGFVELTATPRPGYEFVFWLGDVSDPTARRTTAYLDKPKIVIAVFEKQRNSLRDQGAVTRGSAPAVPFAGGGGGGGGESIIMPTFTGGGGGTSNQRYVAVNPGGGEEGGDPGDPTDPPIPEPATGILLAVGSAMALYRRRKQQA